MTRTYQAEEWSSGQRYPVDLQGAHSIGAQTRSARRICLYSHDSFGLGHLRRNLAIAQELLRERGEFSVTLISGSPVLRQWDLPTGLDIVALPPVVKVAAETYASHDPSKPYGLTRERREAIILQTLRAQRPEFLLVDHAPQGMNGELLAALAMLRAEMPETKVVLGLRDILDAPETVRALWRKQDIERLLLHSYDAVIVYGEKHLFDIAEAYGLGDKLAAKLTYCGHVVAKPDQQRGQPLWHSDLATPTKTILVTLGGGGDGYFLAQAALLAFVEAARRDCRMMIVTGPLMPQDQQQALRQAATDAADVSIVESTTNLVPSLHAADLIIAMAGYNTCAEIIAARKNAIFVPRTSPRVEQLLRARQLAALGLSYMVEPGPELVTNLAQRMQEALAAPARAEAVWQQYDLNGAGRTASSLRELCR